MPSLFSPTFSLSWSDSVFCVSLNSLWWEVRCVSTCIFSCVECVSICLRGWGVSEWEREGESHSFISIQLRFQLLLHSCTRRTRLRSSLLLTWPETGERVFSRLLQLFMPSGECVFCQSRGCRRGTFKGVLLETFSVLDRLSLLLQDDRSGRPGFSNSKHACWWIYSEKCKIFLFQC